MKNTLIKEYSLVEGAFSPDEAFEILINLFSHKINFHNRKNFSDQIRTGKIDPTINERISELKKAQSKIKEQISEANKLNKNLRVSSSILIEIV